MRGWFNVSGGEKADEDTHRDVFLEISRPLLLLLLKKRKVSCLKSKGRRPWLPRFLRLLGRVIFESNCDAVKFEYIFLFLFDIFLNYHACFVFYQL